MYHIGDKVNNPQKTGEIVLWYYDEGNVWVVECEGSRYDCGEHELSPACDAYGHPW